LLVALATFAIIIYTDLIHPSDHINFVIATTFTTFLPLVTILYYKKVGKIISVDTPIREERIELLAIACIYNSLGFTSLCIVGAPPIVQGLMFCYALNTAIVWKITKYWKISIHMVGIGGPAVALWMHGYRFPILMVIIIFIVAISRVRLRAHTAAQVIAGTALAIILAYLELSYLFL
tara:strand:+ start:408 stop:941 length:534 start_codon:yes stop_codon:yes gene_type:complete